MIDPNREVLSKTELAQLFGVNMHTVSGWTNRGCPCRQPWRSQKEPSQYVVADVLEWRRKKAAEGQPQGGRPLETIAPDLWTRPDRENGLRGFAETAVQSYLWHWAAHEEGLQMALGLLHAECGLDKPEAVQAAQALFYGLLSTFTGWVTSNQLDKDMRANNSQGLDALWTQLTGQKVSTTPPTDPELVEMSIHPMLLKSPEQFIRDHWPE